MTSRSAMRARLQFYLMRPLPLLLAAYIAAGVLYALSTPTFEASDEVWHYGFVRELADGRGLPVQVPGVRTSYRQVGSQAPLYYAVAAVLSGWVDDSDFAARYVYNPFAQAGVPGTLVNANLLRHGAEESFPWHGTTLAVYVLRGLSLLLGAGTVALVWRLALELYPQRAGLALLAAALAAFNPMFLFISASVNNDNAVWFVTTALLVLLARPARAEVGGRAGVGVLSTAALPHTLGVGCGIAILCKLSGLVLVPVVAVFFGWRALRSRKWAEQVRSAVLFALWIAAIAGWWFYRNWALYNEVLGEQMMQTMLGAQSVRAGSALEVLAEFQGWWFSLWGVFGAFSVLPGRWVYAVFTGAVLLAVGGGVRAIIEVRGQPGRDPAQYAPHAFAVLFLMLTVGGVIYRSWTQYAFQGRLVLGAIGVIALLLAAGIIKLAGWQHERLLARAATLALFVQALLIPPLYISPHYAAPLALAAVPAGSQSVQAVFNEEFELIAYQVEPARVIAGDPLRVTLYWRALRSMSADYNLALNAHGRAMENVSKLDTWPGGGLLPTANWQAGAIYADTYELRVAPDATAPTRLRLDVSFWVDALDNRLPIAGSDGSALPSVMLDLAPLTEPLPRVYSVSQPAGTSFEGGMQLLGTDAIRVANNSLSVIIYWQASAQQTADYTLFLHVIDADGKLVAQADGPALQGDWPTSAWQPGHMLRDERSVPLPKAMPAGTYTLLAGWYDPVSGTRVGAADAAGVAWRDAAVALGTFTKP
jgi:hypothetical protein